VQLALQVGRLGRALGGLGGGLVGVGAGAQPVVGLLARDIGEFRVDLVGFARVVELDRQAARLEQLVGDAGLQLRAGSLVVEPRRGQIGVGLAARGALALLVLAVLGGMAAVAGVRLGLLTDKGGRTLMIAFARQLRGEVTFCPNPGGGLTAKLVFPTPDVAKSA